MMDKEEEQIEVSLPGAGGAEPTILEVLNRNVIGDCDNEVANQQPPQELHQPKEEHQSDDINDSGLEESIVLDEHTAATQVTDLDVDLDVDDNENDNDHSLALKSDLTAEDRVVAIGAYHQVTSESAADSNQQSANTLSDPPRELKSVDCDIIPVGGPARSASSPILKLVNQRLPVVDNSSNRLSSVEEQSNESESSYSEDSSKQTVVVQPTESEASRPWYLDDDLDPEDQRIIQEAVESILNDAKKQVVEDQVNLRTAEGSSSRKEAAIQDISPLQAPFLLLSSQLLQTHSQNQDSKPNELLVDEGNEENILNNLLCNPVQKDSTVRVTDLDSSLIRPQESSTEIFRELDQTELAVATLSPVVAQSEATSPDSGVESPDCEINYQNSRTSDGKQSSPSSKDIIVSTNETLSASQDTDKILTEDTNETLTSTSPISSEADFINALNATPSPQPYVTRIDTKSFPKDIHNEFHNDSPQPTIDLSSEAKKEYYQYLRDYLNNEDLNRPPVPLKTYQWEDLRRAKKQGGYPWTHLYKRPLGAHEDPEGVTLRASRDRQKFSSESPRSVKKVVRIHEEVLVKETERYISDLSDNETDDEEDDRPEDQREEDTDHNLLEVASSPAGDNYSVQSEPILSLSPDDKSTKITRIKGILKRRLSLKHSKPGSAPESRAEQATPTSRKRRFIGTQRIAQCCTPIMNKLKSMADKQLKKRNIKKVALKDDEKIVLSEKQKILKLKASPKADHSQIPHFIEKQDSDDVMEILQLEESPSKTRKHRQEEGGYLDDTIPVPDEIIDLPILTESEERQIKDQESMEPPMRRELHKSALGQPPEKAPRLRKAHVYEDIDDKEVETEIDLILQEAVQSVRRISQQIEEEMMNPSVESEDDGNDAAWKDKSIELKIVEDFEKEDSTELKSALKRESSPGADKRVTFSHTEDEAEPHREDIILPEEYRAPKRWSNTNDHEYEPIGQPLDDAQHKQKTEAEEEVSSIPTFKISEPASVPLAEAAPTSSSLTSIERRELASDDDEDRMPTAFEQQRDIEERYFSSIPTTPRTDSRTDNEIHTSQVDSSALEELPLKAENRKKGFMASAQDRSRKVSQNIRSQAGKIKTKIRGTKNPPSGSPKAKERKRFKKPDFSKIKMPEMKRPELPKFKAPEMPKFKAPEFKRPEFTKFDKPLFTKPDLSRFKLPETVAIKLRRSRSFKESDVSPTTTETTPESATTSPKKRFDFNFGTYPRMLRKRRQKLSNIVVAKADDLPSTETPPSVESTTLPRQEGGPVSPRWNEKFSEVSYGDSESGKYQRYGSEVESLGRESSIERRMREDLERSSHEQEELEMIHSLEEKQFADYDEENRAIHEISKIREGEFKKRRPMFHQDSDVVSEESKDVGWSEKDATRNALLRSAEESDQEQSHAPEKYTSEEAFAVSVTNTNHDTQSIASSGNRHKGVIEEIDDDEFVLRKRGISQDNIEIRQYISSAIREGLTTPINALAQLGSKEPYYPDEDASDEQMNFGYDVPPPKPKRVPKHFNDFDRNRDTESREFSQEFEAERRGSFDDNTSLPGATEGYFANIPPNRPFRRSKKHYRQVQDHEVPSEDLPYLDDEEDNALFKKMNIESYKQHHDQEEDNQEEPFDRFEAVTPPKAPKRRRKQRDSADKDSYANRFSGRSVSNSFLPSEEREEDFIVYRTQHEYIIPLAQAETFSTPTPAPRRSRSQSHMTDDDRTSRGADSFASESFPIAEQKFHVDMKDSDGYATVRKDPPPRPPAPARLRRASPLPEQRFSTMPHTKRGAVATEHSKRNFNTLGPSRPPRRKSSASMEDSKNNESSPDVTQYEELDIEVCRDDQDVDSRVESPRGDLHSGDVINKMKYRPLPPPPRPPRESRRRGRRDRPDDFDNKFDKDDGAERIACDLQMNGDYNVEKHTDKCIEVEVSTQTDPLPDDFCCEEFEITEDMRVIEPRVGRRLQDFLQDEQDHTSQQHQEDDSLTRSLQRFREASQRSFSEKSRASTADRSRASLGSRPTTPSAMIIEKRVPTPIPNRQGETLLEASLLVLPVDDLESDVEDEKPGTMPEENIEHDESIPEASQQEEEKRLTSEEAERRALLSSGDAQDEAFSEDEMPPIAPPRKRSSIAADAYPLFEEKQISTRTTTLPATEDVDAEIEQQIERSSPFPTRLALAELEVERLSVTELQAGNITVSQLQSSIVRTDELECRSSNLGQSMELPAGLIDEIIKRIRETNMPPETTQTQTVEQPTEASELGQTVTSAESPPPPPRPPLPQSDFPSEYMQYSMPPPSFYALRDPPEGELHPSPIHRRRRHHRRRESSTEDDSHREHRRSRHGTRSPEPTIGQLGGQLLQACGSSVMQSVNHIVNILRANAKEGNDRNISTAIVLVILVTIGFLLLGISGNRNIHHHHWDYFNPPDNKGR